MSGGISLKENKKSNKKFLKEIIINDFNENIDE